MSPAFPPVRAMATSLDRIKPLGIVGGALFLASRILARMTGGRVQLLLYRIMAQPVPPAATVTIRRSSIRVEELNESDTRLSMLCRPADELARRFSTGSRCFAAWHGTQLAGFLWFTPGAYQEEEAHCVFKVRPEDRAVWDMDVQVAQRFRLGRTFALLWDTAFAAMRADGIEWSISRIDAFNQESLRSHERLGARSIGWVAFLRLGFLRLMLTSEGSLQFQRVSRSPYPVLELSAPLRDEARQGVATVT